MIFLNRFHSFLTSHTFLHYWVFFVKSFLFFTIILITASLYFHASNYSSFAILYMEADFDHFELMEVYSDLLRSQFFLFFAFSILMLF